MEDFISYPDALLFLNMTTATEMEEEQINYLISMTTATIVNHCGIDPRLDEDQDCSVLGFVAARMLMRWFPQMASQTIGIAEQSFDIVSIKFTPDTGIDGWSRQILERYKAYTIV